MSDILPKVGTHKKLITLSDREMEMLERIRTMDGHTTVSSVIHYCIKQIYLKRFPLYLENLLKKKMEQELTPEQLCVKKGGVVDEKTGTCRIQEGAITRVVPLSLVGTL